jgi:hypothetical protein
MLFIPKFIVHTTFKAFEWYFMAPGYFQNEGVEIGRREPVRLIVTFYREFLNPITQQTDYVINISESH